MGWLIHRPAMRAVLKSQQGQCSLERGVPAAWHLLLGFIPCTPHLSAPLPHRVLFQDSAGSVQLYDAVHGELMSPPGFQGALAAAVWDTADAGVVAAVASGGEPRGPAAAKSSFLFGYFMV